MASSVEPKDSFLEEFRKSHPVISERAKKSPLPAIRIFCITCFGGYRSEVATCPSEDCPLWPFRLGHRPKVEGADKPKRAAPQALLDSIKRRKENG